MSNMFDNYMGLSETYTPNNLSQKIKKFRVFSNKLPKLVRDMNGFFIGYSWSYGDTVSIPYSVNKTVKVEEDAIILEDAGEAPSTSTVGVYGQRAYNTYDIKCWECVSLDKEQYVWKELPDFTFPYNGTKEITLLYPEDITEKKIRFEIKNSRKEVVLSIEVDGSESVMLDITKESYEKLTKGNYYCTVTVFDEHTSRVDSILLFIIDDIADPFEPGSNYGINARTLEDIVAVAVEEYMIEHPIVVAIDDRMSTESENPVQNKVITNALGEVQSELSEKIDNIETDIGDLSNKVVKVVEQSFDDSQKQTARENIDATGKEEFDDFVDSVENRFEPLEYIDVTDKYIVSGTDNVESFILDYCEENFAQGNHKGKVVVDNFTYQFDVSNNKTVEGDLFQYVTLVSLSDDGYSYIDIFCNRDKIFSGYSGSWDYDGSLDFSKLPYAVRYSSQTLTNEQKLQARKNISATTKIELVVDGNEVKRNDVSINYKQLYEILKQSPDFVYMLYGDWVVRPEFIFESDNVNYIVATSSIIDSSNSKISQVRINSSNGIDIDSITKVVINNENMSNKAVSITEDIYDSVIKYPSVKAMVNFVKEKIDPIDVTDQALEYEMSEYEQEEFAGYNDYIAYFANIKEVGNYFANVTDDYGCVIYSKVYKAPNYDDGATYSGIVQLSDDGIIKFIFTYYNQELSHLISNVEIANNSVTIEDLQGYISYSKQQTLSTTQKTTVRSNIGAISEEDVARLVPIDTTLTKSSEAADAKTVGDKLSEINSDINDLSDILDTAVLVTEQTLDDSEKLQARTNIGAISIDEIANKTEKVELHMQNMKIYKGEQELNFSDLLQILKQSPDFVYLLYNGWVYLPSYIEDVADIKYIRWGSSINNASKTKNVEIYIESIDGSTIRGISITSIDSENSINKVSDIVESDISSTVKYPSIKAVTDYVESKATVIDATLTSSGEAADAKATGDRIISVEESLNGLSFFVDSDGILNVSYEE